MGNYLKRLMYIAVHLFAQSNKIGYFTLMQKSKLLASLKKIQSTLNQSSLQEHFEAIIKYVNNIEEQVQITQTSDMPKLPKEATDLENSIFLYSDGACRGNPGPGAWAFVAQIHEDAYCFEDVGVSEHTTNNKMEMLGVIKALEYAQLNESRKKVFMYTDSKYVVDGLKSWMEGWKRRGWKKADKKPPENLELWQRLDQLNQKMNISIYWVKGHAGHTQNERCDHLANLALDEAGF